MKILLPNGKKRKIEDNLSLDEKKEIVESLTNEFAVEIKMNWNSNSIKFFLDSLANYLVWHKDEGESRHDKEVMSKNKTNRLVRGRKDIPFSSLSKTDKEQLFGGGAE